MKKVYSFILFILLTQTVVGQNIQLEEGSQFYYRISSLKEATNKYNDQENTKSESLIRYEGQFKVLAVSNGIIKIQASGKEVDNYSRSRPLSSKQWHTDWGYSRELVKNDSDGVKAKSMEFDSIIFELKNGMVDNLSNDHDFANLFIKSVFFPVSKTLKEGDEVTQNDQKFKVLEKKPDQFLMSKISNDKGIENMENLIVVDAKTGLLLESKQVFWHRNKENEYRIYTSANKYNSTTYLSDELSINRTNLIYENKEPYKCLFITDEFNQDTVLTKTNVLIRGMVKNAQENQNVSIRWAEAKPGSVQRSQLSTKLDKSGSFEIRLWVDDLQKVEFHCHEFSSFYLMPGDNIELTVDLKEFDETIRTVGTGSSSINFMFDKFLFEEENSLSQRKINNQIQQVMSTLSPEEFKSLNLDILKKKQTYNHTYQYKVAPEVFLAEYWSDQINIVDNLINYPRNQKHLREQAGKEPHQIDKDKYFDFLHLIHPDNNMMVFCKGYNFFIRGYVFFFLKDFFIEISGRGKAVYEDNWIENSYISNYGFTNNYFSIKTAHSLKYIMVCDALEHGSWKVFNDLYEQFKREYPHSQKTRLLSEAFLKAEKLAPGRFAYDFELEDLDGKMVRLSDFKGKGVYINFWATSCGPCRVEIEKYHQEIEKAFDGKNIEFIYIALEDDATKVKKFMELNQVKGTKLIAKGNIRSMIEEKYLFNAIPHHYIIDVEGRIVQRSAPRPSEIISDPKPLLQAMEAQ